ncbi:hypothetical protein JIN77_11380 [Verrucomicrobiaceae bacterium R5-34]|nr:hypothetical protein [Verrucomicrobiaceae bacterium R5-34]
MENIAFYEWMKCGQDDSMHSDLGWLLFWLKDSEDFKRRLNSGAMREFSRKLGSRDVDDYFKSKLSKACMGFDDEDKLVFDAICRLRKAENAFREAGGIWLLEMKGVKVEGESRYVSPLDLWLVSMVVSCFAQVWQCRGCQPTKIMIREFVVWMYESQAGKSHNYANSNDYWKRVWPMLELEGMPSH